MASPPSLIWPTFRDFVAQRSLSGQYYEYPDNFNLIAYDNQGTYFCTLYKPTVSASVLYPPGYDAEQNDRDLIEFQAAYQANYNKPIGQRAPDGRPRIANEKTLVPKVNFYTHDWTDKTTWYPNAVRVVNESPVWSDANAAYQLANLFAIDNYHGKLFNEDFLKDASGNSFRVAVTVDGEPKTEQDPNYGVGGDFTVDYAAGWILPLAGPWVGDVLVTYHYATNSVFTIKPQANKRLIINRAQTQFSKDILINDSIVFQAYGRAGVFAPQLGLPSETPIPIGNPTIYKGIRDLQAEAIIVYPPFPAIGGPTWRGLNQEIESLDWDYLSGTELILDSSEYTPCEIRVSLQHDTPFGGSFGTATFYCTATEL